MAKDTVADFLTSLRNAKLAGKTQIETPSSKLVAGIAKILKSAGFLGNVKIENGLLRLDLKGPTSFNSLKQLSKPGLRRYVKTGQIPWPQDGRGLVILSTPKGLLTGQQARKQRVGGEPICEIW